MLSRENILKALKNFNEAHQEEGFRVVSLFGSYARGNADDFSDIDLTYKMDHERFFKDNAFAKLLKIEEFKEELQKELKKKIDFIPSNSKNSLIQQSLKNEEILV
ncbi:MAG: nucleotidyltransferase domain-containing protein [Sulfurimonas sp.]|uniref:nucleotidyltransferase family protein n=1 Tax=Sulfurimonas sp. TaxID=2022749 RepID=UPI002615D0F0|nr:nucleotidyltransferase domain-containing protein [Sulfurimonas sp.]MDD2652134.1 nucleotidyltransferase domain-containing protein [Sulfurimonas sp.]MDD3451956.1 nucleotidyltransferase domain-containing protein [Sulfurimonas sp.]